MRELVKVAQFLKVVLQEENQGDYDKEQMIFGKRKDMIFLLGNCLYLRNENVDYFWAV